MRINSFSGETPVSGCEKCEKGKYSLGGGKLYSKRTNAWKTPLPIDVSFCFQCIAPTYTKRAYLPANHTMLFLCTAL